MQSGFREPHPVPVAIIIIYSLKTPKCITSRLGFSPEIHTHISGCYTTSLNMSVWEAPKLHDKNRVLDSLSCSSPKSQLPPNSSPFLKMVLQDKNLILILFVSPLYISYVVCQQILSAQLSKYNQNMNTSHQSHMNEWIKSIVKNKRDTHSLSSFKHSIYGSWEIDLKWLWRREDSKWFGKPKWFLFISLGSKSNREIKSDAFFFYSESLKTQFTLNICVIFFFSYVNS